MCNDPDCVMLILGPPDTGTLSLYQVITGSGLPDALQARTATDFRGSVWLAGPWTITGGGFSSPDVTPSLALHVSEPAWLTPVHITTRPESFLATSYNGIITNTYIMQ